MQLAIVTDFEYRVQVIEQVLNEQGWQVLACIGEDQHLEWLLQQPRVDCILIDLNVVGALELLKQLTAALPHMPVVALATPQSITELQNALLAGATTFVTFPVDAKQLVATLARVHAGTIRSLQSREAQLTNEEALFAGAAGKGLGKVIVVTSLKGGVGRSTIAANLAVLLRQRLAREVILLEAHHGLGHLALLLNLYPRHTIKNLDGEANLDLDLLHGLLQRHGSGLRLLAAPTDPAQLVELPVAVWQQVVALLKTSADYVVVDTAAHADELLSTLLAQADEILLVTSADIAGLRDGRILLQALREEMQATGRVHLLLNRAGIKGGIDERMVQEQLDMPIAAVLPDDSALATFAFNRGVPFALSHPRALLSRRLNELSAMLTAAPPEIAEPPPVARPSLFSILGFAR